VLKRTAYREKLSATYLFSEVNESPTKSGQKKSLWKLAQRDLPLQYTMVVS